MAEERLIDADKDKKYRIRKNENGEEELYIDESSEEAQEEEAEFEVPDFAYDDEEAAIMTPEQLHAAIEEKRKEEEQRQKLIEEFTEKANKAIDEGDYKSAEGFADEGLVNDVANAGLNVLKLRAITKDFTDFNDVERCADAADCVVEYCSSEQRKALNGYGNSVLLPLLTEMRKQVAELSKENEDKKAERRQSFIPKKQSAQKGFYITLIPFAVALIATIVFASIMFSRPDGLFVIFTVIFGAITLVCAAFVAVFARKYINAARKVKLNELDTSTKIGRKFITENAKLQMLERIYTAIN